MAVFIILIIIACVIFITGLLRHIPRKPTEQEKAQIPFLLNPELMDYLRREMK